MLVAKQWNTVKQKSCPIEKLAMQFSVSNPRIATTLFSTANPLNVKKNVSFIEEPIDWALVHEVQEIIGEQQRVSCILPPNV